MLDIHITDFYNDTARVLTTLYRHFPRPVSVFVEDIGGPDTPDEYGLHSERHQAAFGTLLWLKDEGLIRYGDIERQLAFHHCVLTLDAFRLLSGFDPGGGPVLIDELRLALKEGSSQMTEAALQRLLGAHKGPAMR